MSHWDDIKTAALLGTERQPFTTPTADGALGELLAGLAGRSSEERLLSTTAALALYRLVGKAPAAAASQAEEPSPTEERPECSRRFALYLAHYLTIKDVDGLKETLGLLEAYGKRAPHALLPPLLDAGVGHRVLRDLVRAVMGSRGAWLAARNQAWKYATGSAVPDAVIPGPAGPELSAAARAAWDEDSREARVDLLRRVRTAAPALARTLLESTWNGEGAEDRVAFVSVLAVKLSMDDEPFLEAALDSRGKETGCAASDLLMRLPESRFVARMIERAAPLLTLQRGPGDKLKFDVAPPETYQSDWLRDGIEQKPPYSVSGDKGWWLAQIIGSVPPGHWPVMFQEPPVRLMEALEKNEWADAVVAGWGRASLRARDAAWIEGLTRHWLLAGKRLSYPVEFVPHLTDLTDVSDDAGAAEEIILDVLQATEDPLHDGHPAMALLREYRRPWSAELSRAVVSSVRQRIVKGYQGNRRPYQLEEGLARFADLIPVSLTEELAEGWPVDSEQWSTWERRVRDFVATLKSRSDYHKEILL